MYILDGQQLYTETGLYLKSTLTVLQTLLGNPKKVNE